MSGGGLRPRPSIRAARLEAQAARAEVQRGSTTAVGAAWREAEERAQPGELEELERLLDLSGQLQRGSSGWIECALACATIRETLIARVSEALAAHYRLKRDALAHGLRVLEAEATQAYENAPPPAITPGASEEQREREAREWARWLGVLFQRPYDLGGLRWRREYAVKSGAAEPISDLEEAGEILEAIVSAVEAEDTRRAEELAIGR